MWAASLAFGQSQPWPPVTLPASSAKNALKTPLQFIMFRRRSLARDEDHGGDKEDIVAKEEKGKDTAGVVGQAVLAAFNKSSTPETPRKATPQLSGSDVLRALEKASIQKTKQLGKDKSKRMGNRDSSSSPSPLPSQGEEHVIKSIGDHAASLDQKSSSDVPLGIKSEWGIRLEELERRLRDIMLVHV